MIFGEDGFWWYETRHLHKQLDQMRIDNHKLRAEVAQLRKVLEVYADGGEWSETDVGGFEFIYDPYSPWTLAQRALERGE